VVPCHRVIGANAKLVGSGGGLARKQWLLAHERVELALMPPELPPRAGLRSAS
jgi:methylated-DNA-[protein]-cysteine S-methyltransferase